MQSPDTQSQSASPADTEGAPESAQQPQDDDQIEVIEDIHGDFDPEDWMSERATYWLDLPDPAPPTRMAWLRHRVAEAFRELSEPHASPWRKPRIPEEDWIAASEQALGPLPRPARDHPEQPQPQEQLPKPNERESARKPQACSASNHCDDAARPASTRPASASAA